MSKIYPATYSIAMIGTGYMARKHCSVLAVHSAARLHTLCSTEKSKPVAQEMAKEYGFRAITTDYDSVLSNPDIHIVFICSPDHTHVDYVIAALQAGKHVFCEKPLARTRLEFEKIQNSLNSQSVLQVGMNCRFREQYLILKKMVLANELNELRFIRGTYIYNMVQSIHAGEKKWSLKFPPSSYPFLHGGGIHCLDLMRWIGGDIQSVFARGAGFELSAEYVVDTFSVSLSFMSGALGELLVSSSAFRPNDFSLELWFRQGSIVDRKIFKRVGDNVSLPAEEIIVEQKTIDLALQYEDMVRAIDAHESPLNSFDEAYANFNAANAIIQSIQDGREVYISSDCAGGN